VARLTRRYHIPSAVRPSSFRVQARAARELVANGAVLIDVRRQYDDSTPLDNALRIPPDMIPRSIARLPSGVPVVLVCSCLREATSVRVAYWLRDRGFAAYAVRGGVPAFLDRAPSPAAATGDRERRPRLALDALRHRRFRRFAAGVLVSQIGSWIEWAAFGYVALLLGGSVAALGLIGFLTTIPNLVLALPAGGVADRFDRRKLVLGLQLATMGLSALLAVLWATGSLTVALMGVAAVVGGSLATLSFPAFHGMLAATVPRADLESAVAINSVLLQAARFVGPAIAGVVLATGGPAWVFALNAVSFLAVVAVVASLPAAPARERRATETLGRSIRSGIDYVRGSRSISSLLALTVLTGLFAVPPIMFMLPAIVRFSLHAGPQTLGALTSVVGLGSLLGAALLLVLSARPNKGEPVIVAYFLTALSVVLVGVSESVALWLALAVIGLARTVLAGLSTVVVQAVSSDEMRARAISVWVLASAGVVPAGGLVTGVLASWFGVGGAVLIDGLALIAGGALILARRPEVLWLGCTTLPVDCLAGTDPAGVAAAHRKSRPAVTFARPRVPRGLRQ